MKADSGVLYICDLVNVAENGKMPKEVLVKSFKHWFERRTIGYNRNYTALGVNQQIDLLVRINYNPEVEIGQYAVLGNGDQYRIDFVSHNHDEKEKIKMSGKNYCKIVHIIGLEYTELTLSKVENYYDVENRKDTKCTC